MSDSRAIAVTGADGFIGLRMCALLEERGFRVARLVRTIEGPGLDRRVADVLAAGDLHRRFAGVEVVIHLAGRAHVIRESHHDPAAAFEQANVEVTRRVAQAAGNAGARRFVFVSSIGVNGNSTHSSAFTETDAPAPVEPYARSKYRAEQLLVPLCRERDMELVIVRPPLVYGPGAKGNFHRLMQLAENGWPLPLGAIRNRRNLIGLENLVDFLCLCVTHPAAAGELFLVAEPEAHSTPGLVSDLAQAFGRSSNIFSVPVGLLRATATMLGRRAEFDKLCGSLEVSSRKARDLLGWHPRVAFAEEIKRCVAAHLKDSRHG